MPITILIQGLKGYRFAFGFDEAGKFFDAPILRITNSNEFPRRLFQPGLFCLRRQRFLINLFAVVLLDLVPNQVFMSILILNQVQILLKHQ